MAARKKSEDGHDAIVRRLLASQSKPLGPAKADAAPAPTPADLTSAARRITTALLPGLVEFGGSALVWTVRQVRSGSWEDVSDLVLASPLTVESDGEPRLAALVACDGPFLTALMAGLFGTMTERRPDPTASELTVFAQLVVRLRDGLDPDGERGLDHAPPEPPADCMKLFAPDDPAPLVVEIEATFAETSGLVSIVMDRSIAAGFLPSGAPVARPTGGMNHMPLAAQVTLAGPRMTLAEIEDLAVGRSLAVTGEPRLIVAGRTVASGRLGQDAGLRAVALAPSIRRKPTPTKDMQDG